jgi:peptide/nickel transport system substrate-binding protein
MVLPVLVGCAAPAGQRTGTGDGASAPAEGRRAGPSPTLTMAFRYELTSMSPKTAQAASGQMQQLFNAGLAIYDGATNPHPQLAATLPRIGTDSWRVLPDGRMETTYTLRPNGTWHDGSPLTADDLVFTWQVYTEPGIGFSTKPQDQIDEVVAVDPYTVLFRWKSLYPDAGELAFDFTPLPRAILEPSFQAYKQTQDAQAFLNQAYWTTAFVGVGPYRLISWEPGAQMEAVAFEGYALGRPKIDRIVARIIGDENPVLTGILSDQLGFAMENTMRFEHGMTLKQDWVPSGRGVVSIRASNVITNVVQFRQEYLKEPGLMDKRVRQAMAWAVDKETVREGLYAGEGGITLAAMSADNRFYPEVERRVNRYTYDPRRTEQLMAEAGYAKDREGFFANGAGDRFRPDYQTLAGSTFERGQAIITDTWWKAGLGVQPSVMSAVQVRDNLARATFPGLGMLLIGAGADDTFVTANIGTASNRWSGGNRGGWSNPEFDRLYAQFNTALDRSERADYAVQMMNMINDEVPGFPMFPDVKVLAYTTRLTGPDPAVPLWNIQEWELR